MPHLSSCHPFPSEEHRAQFLLQITECFPQKDAKELFEALEAGASIDGLLEENRLEEGFPSVNDEIKKITGCTPLRFMNPGFSSEYECSLRKTGVGNMYLVNFWWVLRAYAHPELWSSSLLSNYTYLDSVFNPTPYESGAWTLSQVAALWCLLPESVTTLGFRSGDPMEEEHQDTFECLLKERFLYIKFLQGTGKYFTEPSHYRKDSVFLSRSVLRNIKSIEPAIDDLFSSDLKDLLVEVSRDQEFKDMCELKYIPGAFRAASHFFYQYAFEAIEKGQKNKVMRIIKYLDAL